MKKKYKNSPPDVHEDPEFRRKLEGVFTLEILMAEQHTWFKSFRMSRGHRNPFNKRIRFGNDKYYVRVSPTSHTELEIDNRKVRIFTVSYVHTEFDAPWRYVERDVNIIYELRSDGKWKLLPCTQDRYGAYLFIAFFYMGEM